MVGARVIADALHAREHLPHVGDPAAWPVEFCAQCWERAHVVLNAIALRAVIVELSVARYVLWQLEHEEICPIAVGGPCVCDDAHVAERVGALLSLPAQAHVDARAEAVARLRER